MRKISEKDLQVSEQKKKKCIKYTKKDEKIGCREIVCRFLDIVLSNVAQRG